MKKILSLIGVLLLTLPIQQSFAQCQTSDAGQATYNDSWSNGQNDNAAGFGAWQLSGGTGAGFFRASSNNNDAGTPSLPNINTNSRAWGMFSNSGVTASAVRPFVTAMAIGHSISYSMDNGSINSSGPTVGMSLQNASGQNLMELYFRGGLTSYELNDGSGTNFATGLAFTRGGIDVTITRTATSTYSVSITRKQGGSPSTFNATRTFFTQGDFTPARIRFFNFNAGSGSDFDAFFNNLNLCRPTINASGTLSAVSTSYGVASSNTSFSVSGASMFNGITVTAPAGFEVSTNSGSGFASSILVGGAGTIASTTVFVRLAANAAVTGTYNSQNIVLSSTGASNVNVITAASGNTVSPAALTITGVAANDKTYDGTTTATLSGTPVYNGLQNGESFGVTGTPSANFNNASIGAGKPVTVTGYTAPTTNYTVSQPTGLTADIFAINENNAAFRTKNSGAFSQVATWEFDEGGNWVNASQVPTSNNNITVLHNLTLDQDYTVGAGKNFVLGTGGTLIVNPSRTLTITGAADFDGKAVTFQSTAAGTASLGQVSGSLAGATNVTVERYIRNNGFRSWRLLSVPVSGTQTIRQAWQEGTANPLPLQNNLPNYGTVITGTGNQAAAQAAGFDDVTQAAALLRWNGSAWTGVTSTNQALNNFSAYFLYLRGERSKGVTGAITNSSATTLRATGTVFTGDVVNNVGAGAFALIPNRYPSAINFTGLERTGGVNNLFYIWDSKKQSGGSLGVYQTFSGTNNFVPTIAGGSYSTSVPNTTIESGQAFFVTSGAAGTITLKESAKISGTNGSLGFRPSATPAKIDSRLYSGDDMLDGNAVVFDAAYDRAVDGDDAPKMGNPGANFAIETQSKILAVEGTQQPVHNEAVQFRMWNLQQQAYKLEFAASNITMPGLSAELEDSYLNTSTALDLRGTTTVNFTVDANEASKAANRFRIVFKQAAPLPITFISVSANRSTAGVKADWKVAAERAVRSYEVERSADGRNFTAVGSVTATGNNGGDLDYSFTDAGAPSGTLFYRIRSVGSAGDIKYSTVVKVAAGNVKAGYSISPNPVENGIVNLQFKNQPAGKYSVRVLSNDGKALLINTLTHAGGNSNQLLELPAGLARGTYPVEIISEDRQRTIQTMLVK